MQTDARAMHDGVQKTALGLEKRKKNECLKIENSVPETFSHNNQPSGPKRRSEVQKSVRKPMDITKRPGMRFFWREIKNHLGTYLLGGFAIALTNATELAFPKFMQWGIDTVQLSSTSHVPDFLRAETARLTLLNLIYALFAVAAVAIAGRAIWRQCLAKRSHQSGYSLRKLLWDSLSDQPVNIFSRYPIGDLLNRCISDVNPARFVLGFTHVGTWDVLVYTILGTTSLMIIDPLIAGCTIGVFLLLPLFLKKLVEKEYVLYGEAQNLLSHLSDRIAQMVATARLQRASAMESMWIKSLSSDARTYAAKQFEVEKTAWTCFPFGGAATFASYLLIFSIGLPKVISGELTVGQFVSAMSVVLLMQGPLFSLSDMIAEWQKGLASLNRVAEIIDLEKPRLAAMEAVNTPYEIEVKSLHFQYGKDSSKVLDELHLSIESGEIIGISGDIGAGKSTLLHIISGLELIPEGFVKVRGEDISSLGREEITSIVNLVPQKPFLFAGSIRDNLCLDQTFTEETLWEILGEVRLADDFKALKKGLDTPVGEWGISLSGGQRQRLALARTLLRPRPILLLDDSLSAVDAVTEAHVLSAIKRRLQNVTAIWVAHRASTFELCSKVYTLASGRLNIQEKQWALSSEIEIPLSELGSNLSEAEAQFSDMEDSNLSPVNPDHSPEKREREEP